MSKWVNHRQLRNATWSVLSDDDDRYDNESVQRAILLDIRAELIELNRVLGCPNVAAGFRALQDIAKQSEAAFKRRVAAAARKRIARKARK